MRGSSPAGDAPSPPASAPAVRTSSGVTLRAVLLGLLLTCLVDLWIHWAELVLGGTRGHSALANTSIPVGAFGALMAVVAVNALLRRGLPVLTLSGRELLVIYIMLAVATVLSSSGMLHFVVPTITAAVYFATSENNWGRLIHPHLRSWLVQTDPQALHDFYHGEAPVPLAAWGPQVAAWSLFLVLLCGTTLCLVALLRRQWVDRERLAFPTTLLPLEVTREGGGLWRDPLLLIGTAIAAGIGIVNTLNLNVPAIPAIQVRPIDLNPYFNTPPLNAVGYFPMSFYPFVIGIGYLLPTDVLFSSWFLFLVTRAELVWAAAMGLTSGSAGGSQSVAPYLPQQGAGAFLALAIISLWLARRHLRDAFRGRRVDGERAAPLWAVIGFPLGLLGLVGFGVAAGMRPLVAAVLFVLALLYFTAATRMRAETGTAWLFGPEMDVNRLMIGTFGSGIYTTSDLTGLALMRSVSSFDMRCLPMPHQLEGLRMADSAGLHRGRLAAAMLGATALSAVASFLIALAVWYHFGAAAKTDSWRTLQGRVPWDQVSGWLNTPQKPDAGGTVAVIGGALTTTALSVLRLRLSWWPFHPVGYAMANTGTMPQQWVPFFLAWLAKVVALRYGGMRLYRRLLPFFLGLILGDLLQGAFFTALGCFIQLNIYPMNW